MDTPSLTSVAAGNLGAMDSCLQAYGRVVWSLARRALASDEEAEDATQEIFLEVWKNAERFDPERGSEKTFILTIARRRLVDRLRRQGGRPGAEPLPDGDELVAVEERKSADLEDEVERVYAALAQLKPEQKLVLELCLIHGESHRAIGERIGMPLGTVKSHARRGLKRVRELLADCLPMSPGEVTP